MYRYLAQGGPGTDKCSTKRKKKLGKSTDRKAKAKATKAKILDKKKGGERAHSVLTGRLVRWGN